MKMTKRENVMLMILFVLILMFVYYDILINPRLKKIKRLREEKYILEGQMSKIEHNRNEEKLNQVNVKGLSAEMKLLSVDLFTHLEEEDVINIIDQIISNSGININSMSITTQDMEFGEVVGMSIPKICVTISYTDGFVELMRFLSEIENYKKEIIIRNLSISGGEVVDMIGNITLELYYFPIEDDEKNTEFYPGSKRKNPFANIMEKKLK